MRTLTLLALALTACSTHTEPSESLTHDDANTEVPVPDTTPQPVADELPVPSLSAGINATGLALQPLLFANSEENHVFSPASISIAFGMLATGTAGETRSELYKALHLPESGADEALGGLMGRLSSTGDQPFTVRIANRLWVDTAMPLKPEYVATTSSIYGAAAEPIDFRQLGDAAREPINGWVADQTEQRIEDLLPPGSVSNDTRAVLVNAVYFKADWLNPFRPEATQDRDFTTAKGEVVAVPTMQQQGLMRLAETDGVKIVSLPYHGDTTDFLVVLPDDGDLGALQQRMTPESLDAWYGATTAHMVDLRLPRFELRATYDSLAGPMTALGAGRVFGGDADLSGISAESLEVSDAIHQAFFLVDETGAEAAAATGIVVRATSMPIAPQAQMHVDRPFWFAIRDRATGTLLFTGQVADPRG